ncbi:SOS response-associated peptidase [Desemzia incerta]|uniref:SOS response-associated peptidase n=1 Tax=Desemzia incerta TaxID=82801 RepID=UPI0016601BCA|nr:SOS response-associated peptidase [Desemzia incerta]
MCGRYSLEVSKERLTERYNLEKIPSDYQEREEIFPATVAPIILPDTGLAFLEWGFTPQFAKRPLINARAETILEKPTFSKAFRTMRCLIPTTAFFEWEKGEGKKIKRRITVTDQAIFSIAGICDYFLDEEGKEQLKYSLITTEANDQMKQIHHRMPVILRPEDESNYLNKKQELEKVHQLLKPSELKLVIA